MLILSSVAFCAASFWNKEIGEGIAWACCLLSNLQVLGYEYKALQKPEESGQ